MGITLRRVGCERMLVGNLTLSLQKRIEWDSAAMKATNAPEAEPVIRQTYRSGFGIWSASAAILRSDDQIVARVTGFYRHEAGQRIGP
jgi:hypothetical protein